MVKRTRTDKFRGKERERQSWFDSHFLVPAGLHCLSVSVCSVCSSQSFMWLPGTENLSVSCQRFQLCSVPLSALKNPLFHTHELHYLWPWLKWADSGHAACVSVSSCVCVWVWVCHVADGKQYGTPLPRQMWHSTSQWAGRGVANLRNIWTCSNLHSRPTS